MIKEGDRIEVVANNLRKEFGIILTGSIRIVDKVTHLSSYGYTGVVYLTHDEKTNNNQGILIPSDVKLLTDNKNKKSFMTNLAEKFARLLKGEPEKSFNKAGVTDANDQLTPEGRDLFLNWLLKKNGDDFKKEVVDVLLKEEEDEKNKK